MYLNKTGFSFVFWKNINQADKTGYLENELKSWLLTSKLCLNGKFFSKIVSILSPGFDFAVVFWSLETWSRTIWRIPIENGTGSTSFNPSATSFKSRRSADRMFSPISSNRFRFGKFLDQTEMYRRKISSTNISTWSSSLETTALEEIWS